MYITRRKLLENGAKLGAAGTAVGVAGCSGGDGGSGGDGNPGTTAGQSDSGTTDGGSGEGSGGSDGEPTGSGNYRVNGTGGNPSLVSGMKSFAEHVILNDDLPVEGGGIRGINSINSYLKGEDIANTEFQNHLENPDLGDVSQKKLSALMYPVCKGDSVNGFGFIDDVQLESLNWEKARKYDGNTSGVVENSGGEHIPVTLDGNWLLRSGATQNQNEAWSVATSMGEGGEIPEEVSETLSGLPEDYDRLLGIGLAVKDDHYLVLAEHANEEGSGVIGDRTKVYPGDENIPSPGPDFRAEEYKRIATLDYLDPDC